jgi:hypothetical protein
MKHDSSLLLTRSASARPPCVRTTLRGLGIASLAAAVSCGKADLSDSSPVAESAELGASCNNSATFGFESAAKWSVSAGSISSSSRRIEGAASVQVSAGGPIVLRSGPVCVPAGPLVSGALYVAAAAATGQEGPVDVTLTIDAPSRGIHSTLAPQRLRELGNGFFQRVEFPFPSELTSQLAAPASDIADVRVSIELSSANATHRYLVDGFAFSVGAPPLAATGNPIENRTVSITYPKAIGILDMALLASDELDVTNKTSVVKSPFGFAPVVNVGSVKTEIGHEAEVGDIFSVANVQLRKDSVVTGNVTSQGTVGRDSGAVVTGVVTSGSPLPLREFAWAVPFEIGSSRAIVAPKQRQTLLPGAYGEVTVKPNGTLSLSTGTYYVEALDVDTNGELALNTSLGPVIIYTRKDMRLRGRMTFTGRAGDLLLVQLGAHDVDVEGTFGGTLVAPFARVTFGNCQAELVGAAFAKSISLQAQSTFKFRPPFSIIGRANPKTCVELLADGRWKQDNTSTSYQDAVLRYCGGSGVGSCENALLARINVDLFTAAQRVIQETMSPSAHLALIFDRDRKKSLFHGNEALACEILNGDADGDFVPISRDQCPATPELTATFDNGCTDPNLPPAPPIGDVKKGLGSIVVSGDPRCHGVGSPVIPAPFGAWRFPPDPSVGKALWISKDPDTSGCPTWYQLEGQLTDGTVQTITFTAADSTDLGWIHPPANTFQFNIRPIDGGGRAAWASYAVFTNQYRVRALNAAGRRSAWSSWYQPGHESCAAGACND